MVYLDDIINLSNSLDDHHIHVGDFLPVLRDAESTLKLRKRKFFTDTVKYLRQNIHPGRLAIEKARAESLVETKKPVLERNCASFRGLINVYRLFLQNFRTLQRPSMHNCAREIRQN